MKSRGLVIVNLGSPDSPEVRDVRKYLRQFLLDERVIDVPFALRKLIVEGFILPFRPKRSAEAYASVWTKDGAPLKVYTEEFMKSLQPLIDLPVATAMRYGSPSPRAALQDLETRVSHLDEIWIAPLYPHYAKSSYETALVYVKDEIQKIRPHITFRILKPFYQEAGYVQSLADSIRPYLKKEFDHLLFSYHGLPVRHLRRTDPTKQHCYASANCCDVISPASGFCYKHQVITTTRLVSKLLSLPSGKFSYSFQSRLGQDEWIKPFTVERLEQFPSEGIKNLVVVCPAFVSDCLETVEEIAIRGRQTFLNAGGQSFQLIPCLNASPAWVKTFAGYCNLEESDHQKSWMSETESLSLAQA
jgi:protoporphyrin/coproporphyrin ferrochelatase